MSPNNQINELTRLFKENAHDENATQMAQYMKGHFLFFGIKSTLRRDIQREWWKGHQYVGLDLGKQYKEYFIPASILFIQQLITIKPW